MAGILDTVISFLQEDNWPFTPLEEGTILRTGFQGVNGEWSCYAQTREEQEQFIFYSVCPVHAPEEARMAAAEYLTRANYGLYIGNFELDLGDGEVRYKTSIDVEGSSLTLTQVKQLVYANVLTMDRYLPGLMKVIYGNVAPVDAITEIEGPGWSDTQSLSHQGGTDG
jgi:hypothetical protein